MERCVLAALDACEVFRLVIERVAIDVVDDMTSWNTVAGMVLPNDTVQPPAAL